MTTHDELSKSSDDSWPWSRATTALLSQLKAKDAEIAQLRAELERVGKDAERLNFMQENWFYYNGDSTWGFNFNETWESPPSEHFREAIDAAIAGEKDKT